MATVVKQSCNGLDAAPYEQAGPFLIGKELTPVNAAPVKIIKEYLGKRPGSDEIVLLKVLAASKADYDNIDKAEEIRQGKMLLLTEFTILSMLHGMPGICRHHGLFKDKVAVDGSEQDTERVILALDCYHPHVYSDTSGERVNLQQYVIKQKRLPEKEALKLFHEIVTIISKMHASNIVHRDLKLGNMILNLRTRKVTIVNFCLSKHLFPSEEKLTDQRGSLAYVSPDILSGAPYCGKASDCWALGVLLYTMLYGQFPFYDCSPHELFKKIKSAQYVIPSDGHVSLGTKFLISRLITLDPAKRLTAVAALEETQRIISKWHSMNSGHEALSPSVPDIDFSQNGSEDFSVPTSTNHTASLSSLELNAPRLAMSDINQMVSPNESEVAIVRPDVRNLEPSLQRSTSSNNSGPLPSMLSRRGVNHRNLHLNLRRSSPPLPHQNSATPTYSYTAIGHTPTSPPPIVGGSPQPSMFAGQLHHPHPTSPGVTAGSLVYSYVPSPVSGVPDNSGFFRFIPSGAQQPVMARHNVAAAGLVFITSGNKRRRESVEHETERIRVLESPRGDPLSVRVANS